MLKDEAGDVIEAPGQEPIDLSYLAGSAAGEQPEEQPEEEPVSKRWAVDFNVATAYDDIEFEVLRTGPKRARGYGGGQIYRVGVSAVLAEYAWQIGEQSFHPRLEVPVSLGVADDNDRSPYWMCTGALAFRWVDFPWNKYLRTSVALGGGLWYSDRVPAIAIHRHPGEKRAHLKFYLPLELTLALPRWAEYELVLFNHHASGAHLLDEGGFDVWGVGFRYWF